MAAGHLSGNDLYVMYSCGDQCNTGIQSPVYATIRSKILLTSFCAICLLRR